MTDLYNPNDGLHGRDGGPYLDQVQREAAEKQIAFREGREPDYDNLPLTAGTPLVSGEVLLDISNPLRIAGDREKTVTGITVEPVATIDDPEPEAEDEPVDEPKVAEDDALFGDGPIDPLIEN